MLADTMLRRGFSGVSRRSRPWILARGYSPLRRYHAPLATAAWDDPFCPAHWTATRTYTTERYPSTGYSGGDALQPAAAVRESPRVRATSPSAKNVHDTSQPFYDFIDADTHRLAHATLQANLPPIANIVVVDRRVKKRSNHKDRINIRKNLRGIVEEHAARCKMPLGATPSLLVIVVKTDYTRTKANRLQRELNEWLATLPGALHACVLDLKQSRQAARYLPQAGPFEVADGATTTPQFTNDLAAAKNDLEEYEEIEEAEETEEETSAGRPHLAQDVAEAAKGTIQAQTDMETLEEPPEDAEEDPVASHLQPVGTASPSATTCTEPMIYYTGASTAYLSDRVCLHLPPTANVLVLNLTQEWTDKKFKEVEASLRNPRTTFGYIAYNPGAYTPPSTVWVPMQEPHTSDKYVSRLPLVVACRTRLSPENAKEVQRQMSCILNAVSGNEQTTGCVLDSSHTTLSNPLDAPSLKPRPVQPRSSTADTAPPETRATAESQENSTALTEGDAEDAPIPAMRETKGELAPTSPASALRRRPATNAELAKEAIRHTWPGLKPRQVMSKSGRLESLVKGPFTAEYLEPVDTLPADTEGVPRAAAPPGSLTSTSPDPVEDQLPADADGVPAVVIPLLFPGTGAERKEPVDDTAGEQDMSNEQVAAATEVKAEHVEPDDLSPADAHMRDEGARVLKKVSTRAEVLLLLEREGVLIPRLLKNGAAPSGTPLRSARTATRPSFARNFASLGREDVVSPALRAPLSPAVPRKLGRHRRLPPTKPVGRSSPAEATRRTKRTVQPGNRCSPIRKRSLRVAKPATRKGKHRAPPIDDGSSLPIEALERFLSIPSTAERRQLAAARRTERSKNSVILTPELRRVPLAKVIVYPTKVDRTVPPAAHVAAAVALVAQQKTETQTHTLLNLPTVELTAGTLVYHRASTQLCLRPYLGPLQIAEVRRLPSQCVLVCVSEKVIGANGPITESAAVVNPTVAAVVIALQADGISMEKHPLPLVVMVFRDAALNESYCKQQQELIQRAIRSRRGMRRTYVYVVAGRGLEK